MKKLLEINHCRKSFDGTEVLTDLSLAVEESQVLSIIGPSGSGKSTLLRCATLLETMDGGDLIYDGHYAARDHGGKAVSGGDGTAVKLAVAHFLVECLVIHDTASADLKHQGAFAIVFRKIGGNRLEINLTVEGQNVIVGVHAAGVVMHVKRNGAVAVEGHVAHVGRVATLVTRIPAKAHIGVAIHQER